MKKLDLRDMNLRDKVVFLRADFNVPLDSDGKITDDFRIKASLPTIKYILDEGSKLIVTSHLGRPKGFEPGLSLAPVCKRLNELLGNEYEVILVDNCLEKLNKDILANFNEDDNKKIIMLENTRFYVGETKNDAILSRKYASLCSIMVNDAFGTAHRKHSSNYGISQYVPAIPGFLLEKEIRIFSKINSNPEKPFVTIFGGKKLSDKIKIISRMMKKSG